MGASRSICSITSLTAPDCLSGGYLYLISSRLIERSRSNLGSVTPRKSNKYGSFVACCAMSDCSGGSVSPKLLIAFPARSWSRVSIWWARMLLLQPSSTARPAYDSRVSRSRSPVEQRHLVTPRQLGNWKIRPGCGEGAHESEVARRESPRVRDLALDVHGEPVDNPGSPALSGAQASLGLVRASEQLPVGAILTLGPRRVVMAFDPACDDVHLLRCVVQLLRVAALAASVRVESGELTTADKHLTSALQTLERIGKIRKSAGQIKVTANDVAVGAEALQTELARSLA